MLTGLILPGGGGRAAYQVGVLSALFELLDPDRRADFRNPFDIICGTSAGAINATSLACHAHDPHGGMARLCELWGNLRSSDVYHTDPPRLMRTGLRWLGVLTLGWMLPGLREGQPRSLLDNSPLGDLLGEALDFDRLQHNFVEHRLSALAITAAAYTTGEHMTFYQAHQPIQPWRRSLRQAIPTLIGVPHLLASSAIPFVFPAQPVQVDDRVLWCGDGSMRQLAPMSPAIHLGAERVVVIGTGYRDDTHPAAGGHPDVDYPSLAQIGGHALSNIFLDSLAVDIERLERVNRLLAQLPANRLKSESLRPVNALVITPSRSLDDLALAHLADMPLAVRRLFRVLGISARSGPSTGGALLSYLLFESSYTTDLIRLGRADMMSRARELKEFFMGAGQ